MGSAEPFAHRCCSSLETRSSSKNLVSRVFDAWVKTAFRFMLCDRLAGWECAGWHGTLCSASWNPSTISTWSVRPTCGSKATECSEHWPSTGKEPRCLRHSNSECAGTHSAFLFRENTRRSLPDATDPSHLGPPLRPHGRVCC